MILFGFVQQQFFPSSSRPELMVDLRLAQNASIAATEAEVLRFEKILLADPDIDFHSFYVGSGAVRFYLPLNQQLENANFAQAVVITKGYEVRDAVRARLEKVLAEDFPTLMARVEPLALGPPVDWPLQYRVSGPDVSGVRAMAETVAATLRANANTRVVNFDWNEMTKDMHIRVDQEKARQLGVTSEQISRSLASALSGRTITQFRDDIYLIDVQGRAQASDRGDLARIRDLEIGILGGNSVPLAQIATFEYGLEETVIWRRNRLPTITIQSKVADGLTAATVTGQLKKPIEDLMAKLPPGYRIEIGGAVGESAKGSASIMAVMPVMFILMLFILMLQLHSTQKLLLVMLTAPLAIIGVTIALLISNRPFGFVAMLGVFALVGMIIRNSVVLMAQIKENEDAGMERGAAIVDATMHRLRPILLTAAAAILGLIPIVSEVFWGPMAIAMMGGLFIATVLTLIFLPALYASWYRVRRPVAPKIPARQGDTRAVHPAIVIRDGVDRLEVVLRQVRPAESLDARARRRRAAEQGFLQRLLDAVDVVGLHALARAAVRQQFVQRGVTRRQRRGWAGRPPCSRRSCTASNTVMWSLTTASSTCARCNSANSAANGMRGRSSMNRSRPASRMRCHSARRQGAVGGHVDRPRAGWRVLSCSTARSNGTQRTAAVDFAGVHDFERAARGRRCVRERRGIEAVRHHEIPSPRGACGNDSSNHSRMLGRVEYARGALAHQAAPRCARASHCVSQPRCHSGQS